MRTIIASLAIASGCLSTFAQEAPKLLPFQGRLTDAQGAAVADGSKLILFEIYEVPTGGNATWPGEMHKTTVNGGLVNVLLGSKSPFGATTPDFNKMLYLQITIDSNADNAITSADPPLLPRQVILPAVFAKEAADSRRMAVLDAQGKPVAGQSFGWDGIFDNGNPASGRIPGAKLAKTSVTSEQLGGDSVTSDKIVNGTITADDLSPNLQAGSLPVGSVVMWWGAKSAVPTGWEICDGAAPTTAGALVSGNKPNLLDRFPKGAPSATSNAQTANVSGGASTIPQRTTGGTAITVAQMPSHGHAFTRGTVAQFGSDGIAIGIGATSDGLSSLATGKINANGGGQAHDHSIPSHDNRPAFLELFFIIRVK